MNERESIIVSVELYYFFPLVVASLKQRNERFDRLKDELEDRNVFTAVCFSKVRFVCFLKVRNRDFYVTLVNDVPDP